MDAEWILLLVYFSGRLFFYKIDSIFAGNRNGISYKKRLFWGLLIFVLTAGFFEAILLYIIYLAMISAEYFLHPANSGKASLSYSLQIALAFIVWPLVLTLFLPHLPYILNPVNHLWNTLEFFLFPDTLFKPEALVEILVGYILVLKEGTIFTRLALSNIKAEPANQEIRQKPDAEEYERGRVIGILERSFYYFLILSNNLGGVAVIIALKSLARFKKLDQKEFAEYFLIGSLLSLAAAAIPAVVIQLLL